MNPGFIRSSDGVVLPDEAANQCTTCCIRFDCFSPRNIHCLIQTSAALPLPLGGEWLGAKGLHPLSKLGYSSLLFISKLWFMPKGFGTPIDTYLISPIIHDFHHPSLLLLLYKIRRLLYHRRSGSLNFMLPRPLNLIALSAPLPPLVEAYGSPPNLPCSCRLSGGGGRYDCPPLLSP